MWFCTVTCFNVVVCDTAAVPVHVDINPPLPGTAEQNFIDELTRAHRIIDQLMQTSRDVIGLIHRLTENPSADDLTTADQLTNEFEAALYQGGIPPGLVPSLAYMLAHNVIRGIRMVLTRHGESIVVYFLCKTVKAHYDLGQMIVSGFMHAVFDAAIQSVARTTVDVYVRADEFNLKLLCLSSPQRKGLSTEPR